jgi:hypothetical protein
MWRQPARGIALPDRCVRRGRSRTLRLDLARQCLHLPLQVTHILLELMNPKIVGSGGGSGHAHQRRDDYQSDHGSSLRRICAPVNQ